MVSAFAKIFSRSFTKDEKGSVFILLAAAIPLLLGLVALAVDMNHFQKISSHVQNAADQAAISAASVDGPKGDDEYRTEVARKFFMLNFPPEMTNFVELTYVSAKEDFSTGRLTVTLDIEAEIKNQFGGFIGFDSTKFTRTVTAERQVDDVEVVLSMAYSGTMCSHKNRSPNSNPDIPGDVLVSLTPDEKCTDFNAMKDGVEFFIKDVGRIKVLQMQK